MLYLSVNKQKGTNMAKDLENTMVDNNVHILTSINPETTNGLIMQLTRWVNALPVISPKQHEKIYSPYEVIPDNIPVLNVWINSGGGNVSRTESILNMFNIASARGTIIKTYNIGRASSCASQIAVSGTPGYRYMGQNTYHWIHYGNSEYKINHPEEAEYAVTDFKNHLGNMYDTYKRNTRLTGTELNEYFKTEGAGQLYAEQCLDKGLCDWVITNDGRFVNSVSELKKQNQR